MFTRWLTRPKHYASKVPLQKLSGNQITDIAPLKALVALRSLYLADNQLTDLTPIAEHKKLWSLYLSGNKLNSLDQIAGLTRVSSLDLRGNEITDLAPLKGYTELKYLFINDNKVTDLAVLVEMAKADNEGQKRFSPFWKIYLAGNPLSDGVKAQVETLKSLGARITE